MKYLALCFLLAAGISSQAQTTITFRDDFQDNRNKWYVNEGEKCSVGISGGNYFFDVKNDWGYWQNQWTGLSAATSFTVETSVVKQPGGAKGASCGLMLTTDNWDRLMFLINPTTGEFVFTRNIPNGNKWEDISKWGPHASVKGEGEKNILRIEKAPGSYRLMVNGAEVFKSTSASTVSYLSGHVHIQAGFDKIKAEFDYLQVDYSTDVKMVADCIKGYKKINLGSNVNTAYGELCPLISPDGKTLYYTIRDDPANYGKKGDDIWYCEATSDTTWSMRKNMGRPLNNDGINTMISITPDGNYALLMNRYDEEGESVGGGVSSVWMGKKGWKNPQELFIKNLENKASNVEYCLSADGNVLLMAIETDKTQGERDIYASFRNKRGKVADKLKIGGLLNKVTGEMWSEPMNLGPVVNSKKADFSPFLAADGVSLYYSSCGHKGFGNCDIFVTRRLDSTWTKWSEPLNLGPEINSFSWEAYYVVPASGKYAYLITDANTIGGTDLVRIQLPAAARPKPVILVRGKVLNAKTKEPLEAPIVYRELKTNAEIGSAISNPATGEYQIVLPYGMEYSFIADRSGFFAINDNLDASTITEYREIQRDLYLTPIEVGTIVRLNNIFFDVNKAVLKEESFPELNRVVDLLKENKGMEIEIGGHTDNVGSDDYNLKLSDDRTKAVVDYLVSKGGDAAKLKNKGYGEVKPLASNDTEEGKALNRRVEFTVLKK